MSGPSKQIAKLEKAIQAGNLEHVPELLTDKFLGLIKSGTDKQNGFHLAAQHGQLNKLPATVMSYYNLGLLDRHGRSSYHIAARFGNLMQIPNEVNDLDTFKDGFGRNILHSTFLGQFGDVKLIPPQYLTQFCFEAKDNNSETPIHYAAKTGKLGQLLENERYVKFSDLFKEDNYGVSAFGFAAAYGQLDQIPLPQDWRDHFRMITRHVHRGKKDVEDDAVICQKADLWLVSWAQKILAGNNHRK